MSWLSALSHGLVTVERWVSQVLVLAFVTLIVVNVAMRYLAGRPLVYAEELAAILLVWLVFVATSITVHDRAQIGVTMLIEKLPFEMRGAVDLAVLSIVAAVLGVLLWFSVRWVLSPAVAFEQVITTGWGKVPFFWIVPVFSATALVHILADLAEAITRHRPIEIAQGKGLEP